MPMFEYRCHQCGHLMEVLVMSSGKALPKVVCEKCGSVKTEKVISGFSVGPGKTDSGSCPTCCPTGTCGL